MSTPGVFQDGVVEPYGSVYELQGPGVGSHGLLRALQGPYASLKAFIRPYMSTPGLFQTIQSLIEPYYCTMLPKTGSLHCGLQGLIGLTAAYTEPYRAFPGTNSTTEKRLALKAYPK